MAASTRTQAERLWLLGGGLAGFVLLLVGYVLFISPQRSQTSDARSSLSSVNTQNSVLESHITTLREQSKNMASIKTQLAAAQSALPSSSGVPSFIRMLQALGGSTHAHVTSLTVGSPTDVSALANGAQTNATPTATAAPASSTSTTAVAPGAAAIATGPSVFALSLSAQVSGSDSALNQFLDQLHSVQPRAVLITQISESSAGATGAGATGAGASAAGTTMQLTMQVFVAPSPTAPTAAPTPTQAPR